MILKFFLDAPLIVIMKMIIMSGFYHIYEIGLDNKQLVQTFLDSPCPAQLELECIARLNNI